MRQIPLRPFLFMVVVGAAACAKGPVAPTATTQTSVAPTAITISGTTTLHHPGDTGRLDAVVTFADGTTRTVTADAGWTIDRGNIVSVLRGALTARAYGQCYVTVTYGPVSARALVRVIPDGMFLLSGRVTEDSGLPLWQARVCITMSTDQMGATTDTQGFYMLPARGDSEVRVEADDFEPQLKRVTVPRDDQLDFRLAINCRGFGGTYV